MKIKINKLILLLAIAIAITHLASASLQVSPSSMSINLNYAERNTYHLNFTNNFNSTIYNLTLKENPIATMNPIDVINAHGNYSRNIIINGSQLGDNTYPLTFTFYMLQTFIDTPQTHNVGMFSSHYAPTSLNIKKQDTVIWTNYDSILHTVTDNGGEFNSGNIAPNATWSKQFTSVKSYTIRDIFIGYTMTLNVQNNTHDLFTYDPADDATVSVTTHVTVPTVYVQLSIITKNITMDYDEIEEGVVLVKNVGGSKAFDVHLSANQWTSFDENNFNLNPSEENFVLFTVDPSISSTDDTNKTHYVDITVTGTNFDTHSDSVSVFINYAPIVISNTSNLSYEELIERIKSLQDILANTQIVVKENQTIYLPANVHINDTESEWENQKYLTAQLVTMMTELGKRVNQLYDESITNKENITRAVIGLQAEEEREDEASARNSVFGGLLIIASLVLIIFLLNKYGNSLIKKKEADF